MVINWLKFPRTKEEGKRKSRQAFDIFILANICFFHLASRALIWDTLLACLMSRMHEIPLAPLRSGEPRRLSP